MRAMDSEVEGEYLEVVEVQLQEVKKPLVLAVVVMCGMGRVGVTHWMLMASQMMCACPRSIIFVLDSTSDSWRLGCS